MIAVSVSVQEYCALLLEAETCIVGSGGQLKNPIKEEMNHLSKLPEDTLLQVELTKYMQVCKYADNLKEHL